MGTGAVKVTEQRFTKEGTATGAALDVSARYKSRLDRYSMFLDYVSDQQNDLGTVLLISFPEKVVYDLDGNSNRPTSFQLVIDQDAAAPVLDLPKSYPEPGTTLSQPLPFVILHFKESVKMPLKLADAGQFEIRTRADPKNATDKGVVVSKLEVKDIQDGRVILFNPGYATNLNTSPKHGYEVWYPKKLMDKLGNFLTTSFTGLHFMTTLKAPEKKEEKKEVPAPNAGNNAAKDQGAAGAAAAPAQSPPTAGDEKAKTDNKEATGAQPAAAAGNANRRLDNHEKKAEAKATDQAKTPTDAKAKEHEDKFPPVIIAAPTGDI